MSTERFPSQAALSAAAARASTWEARAHAILMAAHVADPVVRAVTIREWIDGLRCAGDDHGDYAWGIEYVLDELSALLNDLP